MLIGKRFRWLYPLVMAATLALGLPVLAGPASASNSLPAPFIGPNGGNFDVPPSVTICDTAVGDPIYYTTDNSDPETNGTRLLYTGAFTVSQSETVSAGVYDPVFGWGSVTSNAFHIYSSSLVRAPVISPDGGSFTTAQAATISGIPSGGTCYYTTDSSEPQNYSTPYTGPFTVSQSERIEAIKLLHNMHMITS